MRTVRRALMWTCVAVLAHATTGAAQVTPKVEDLAGTWERVSTKDIKTGVVTRNMGVEWLQLTGRTGRSSEWTPGANWCRPPSTPRCRQTPG